MHNAARAPRRFAPCSTFKIPNSLIALDSGAASDPGFTLEYDPKRDGKHHGAWNRDQDLRSALRNTAAWYYQELALRVGAGRMKAYLDRFEFGDRSLAGGVDRFWLGGGLRISAEEQVEFLKRFRENRLGIPPQTAVTIREMLLLETAAEYRWFGKTGTCTDNRCAGDGGYGTASNAHGESHRGRFSGRSPRRR